MYDCSGIAQWLRRRKRVERKSSDPTRTEQSSSNESLDSGFVELSETSSSISLKSILRQHVNNTTGVDPKKKVSICAPTSPKSLSRTRFIIYKGETHKTSSEKVPSDREEEAGVGPTPVMWSMFKPC